MARRVAAGRHVADARAPAGAALAEGWCSVVAAWRTDEVLAPQSGARPEEIGARLVARLQRSGRKTWDEVSAAFVAARAPGTSFGTRALNLRPPWLLYVAACWSAG